MTPRDPLERQGRTLAIFLLIAEAVVFAAMLLVGTGAIFAIDAVVNG